MSALSDPARPRLLVVGTGHRRYREYLLASIAPHYRVHLLIGHPADWERRYVDGWSVVDLTDTVGADEMIRAAGLAAEREPFDGVLTWDEARVLQAAKLAQALRLPGGDPDMVLRCRDKHLTRTALAAAGVPQPRSVMVASPAEALSAAADIGYPVVLKPRAMAASLGVVRADNPEQLSQRFGFARDTTVPGAWRYDLVLVEEYLTGPEISVDAAVHRGRALPLFLARKQVGYPPYFEEVGHLVNADDPLLSDPALLRILQDTHDALAFSDGMTHSEFKLTATGVKVVEVNARLGGGLIPYLGQRATGIEPGVVAAAVACGRAPSVVASQHRCGAVRFFYVEQPNTTIDQIRFEPVDHPALDTAGVLAEPGQRLSPPPAGSAFDRAAFATAVAGIEAECLAALDAAERALVVRGR
ncbi:MAG TPA: ATP-grasp domain-containing protein [Jatrophihabitans sp.]|nr:ATP-grasp domain-containing protein [Jatrophihabitans sp.]